jgi:flagellar basal-body rod modification protein FlgD
MAAASGIWNQMMQRASAQTGSAHPMAGPGSGSSTSSTSSTSSSASTISSTDFLTLLVTEMKNQDPTASNDPNEYVNQLVAVNSLQQLISINENLQTALGVSSATSSTTNTGKAAGATSTHGVAQTQAGSTSHTAALPDGSAAVAHGNGNLSTPSAWPSAERVASSLSGHAKTH